ncbi:hypothetical protein SUSAZ_10180 [Sulfolobus acidocaldarius SUSAZ]|nr:hypothetical protein SUSAZ_10180 [Sulfolobus acidocaldarius SUSAZ]
MKFLSILVNVIHENYKVKVKVPEDLANRILEDAYQEIYFIFGSTYLVRR